MNDARLKKMMCASTGDKAAAHRVHRGKAPTKKPPMQARGDRGGHVTVVERRVPNCTVPAVVISGNSNEEPNRIIEVGVGEKSETSVK